MGCSHEFGSLLVSVPESDKAGQSPRGRKGKLSAIEILNTVENHECTICF